MYYERTVEAVYAWRSTCFPYRVYFHTVLCLHCPCLFIQFFLAASDENQVAAV